MEAKLISPPSYTAEQSPQVECETRAESFRIPIIQPLSRRHTIAVRNFWCVQEVCEYIYERMETNNNNNPHNWQQHSFVSAVRHIFATNYSVAKKRYWVQGQQYANLS